MSDRHHHHHGGGGGQQRYFKTGDGGYGHGGGGGTSSTTSKRYHSPVGGSGGGGGSGSYYDPIKRSRSDIYSSSSSANFGGAGGGSSSSYHHHTPSSSSTSRYNEYGSSGTGSTSSYNSRYKSPSSSTIPYYDTGLKSSRYAVDIDDYNKVRTRGTGSGGSSGMLGMKSSVRRIPPPPTISSMSMSSSSKMMSKSSSSGYGSGSSRPLPLMKVSIPSASGSGGTGSRDGYGGSRLRTAPPEHHSTSSYPSYSSSSSTTFRKPELKRPGVLRNPYGPTYPKSSSTAGGGSSSFKRATLRTAASVTSRIRKRAPIASTYDDRRKRIESYSSSRRDLDRTTRTERRKAVVSTREKKRESDAAKGVESSEGKKKVEEVKLPDGEVGVVLDEVGGDSDSDDNVENKDEDESSPVKAAKGGENDEAMDADTSKENQDEKCEHGEEDDHEDGKCKARRRDSHDKEGSPSSHALLKLYCKYCDVRHVTFREYSHHLRSYSHVRAMNTSVTEMRKKLSKIRTQQRDEQRRAEKEEKVELSDTTSYCRVCELNFRTDPKEHEANELHNEIKTIIYQRCEICDIDFRIWKVYLYHMAALEHVKRIAMKELKEAEGKVDGVKGTNLTQEELGADLVEIRTVFFCNACVRYLPIKGEVEEAKERHCMTLTHVKAVEEFRQREKKIAERQRIRMEREEREKERKLKEKLKEEMKSKETTKTTDEADGETSKNEETIDGGETVSVKTEQDGKETGGISATASDDVKIEADVGDVDDKKTSEVMEGEEQDHEGAEGDGDVEDQDQDLDEIELHAEGDEEDDENDKSWNRRTRSAKITN